MSSSFQSAPATCAVGPQALRSKGFLAFSLAVSVSVQGKTPIPPDDEVPAGTLSIRESGPGGTPLC